MMEKIIIMPTKPLKESSKHFGYPCFVHVTSGEGGGGEGGFDVGAAKFVCF